MEQIERWAEFSEETPPRCRFALGRMWAKEKGAVLFCGLNPSKADAQTDDMTVTKGIGFARLWGFGATIHVNAFPYISTYPEQLRECFDTEIERNDHRLVELAQTAAVVVLMWGAFDQFQKRFWKVTRLLRPFNPICLGRTKDGYPKHISRIAYSSPREPWDSVVAER